MKLGLFLEEEDTVEFTFEHPGGTGSLSGVPALSSAIGRPFRQLFDTGNPVGRINYLFFQPPDGPRRTLGALCYTPWKRVLFFPGLATRRVPWYTGHDGKTQLTAKTDESLDHITLEANFDTWHATILTAQAVKETRIPKRHTRQIGKDLIFWFALSVRNPSVLETTPKTTTLGPFPVSSTYSQKLAALLMEAREDAVFRILQLQEEQPIANNQFITFEFFIDRSSRIRLWLRRSLLRRYGHSTPVLYPIAVPAVRESPKAVDLVLAKTHDVEIPGFRGCFTVTVYRTTGILAEEAILSGY
ncbi:hypothetical protein D4R54_02150 [archaeon]|nr:MAG: hypothetical protein D4R54_02150 [archaeon]